MAIHGIDKSEENWFVCEDDPGRGQTLEECRENDATIFFFTAIPNLVITDIQDDQSSNTIRALEGGTGMEQVMNQRTSRRNRDCFRFAIKRVENFSTPKGDPIPMTFGKQMRSGKVYDVVDEDFMDHVHPSTINEVGAHVFKHNSMDAERRKNLEAVLSGLGGSKSGIVDNAAVKTSTNGDASATQEQAT